MRSGGRDRVESRCKTTRLPEGELLRLILHWKDADFGFRVSFFFFPLFLAIHGLMICLLPPRRPGTRYRASRARKRRAEGVRGKACAVCSESQPCASSGSSFWDVR